MLTFYISKCTLNGDKNKRVSIQKGSLVEIKTYDVYHYDVIIEDCDYDNRLLIVTNVYTDEIIKLPLDSIVYIKEY